LSLEKRSAVEISIWIDRLHQTPNRKPGSITQRVEAIFMAEARAERRLAAIDAADVARYLRDK
jgi:hypothetical protein